MKRIITIVLYFICNLSFTKASENPNWSISTIPAELLVRANAVIRNYETTINISIKGEAEEIVYRAITILNENGNQYSFLFEPYDKYSSISGLDGVVYDKNGKKIRKIRMDEFMDVSAISDFSLYEDNRLKVAEPKVGDYPFTVVYEYRKKHKSFFAFPSWQVYPGYSISIQKFSYKLIVDPSANFKYKGNDKFNLIPVTSEEKGVKTLLWSIENQPAIEKEPLSSDFSDYTPVLMVVPYSFSMDNYKGSNSSWIYLGRWIFMLGRNRYELPEPTKNKVNSMISGANNDFEKAKILYEFLQEKVRYVSIQVGIGGFQPFPAETVDRLSYGDCKALTNYMKSLLDIAGIKSYYCLVRAGTDAPNIDKDFVCSQFNHAFLMLPINNDTLFLECTSQHVPFGYNGTFTDDRDILVIDSTNSYIKHTNIYRKEQNNTINSFTFKIGNQMDCNVSQKSNYIGVASEDIRNLMIKKPEEQRENILKRFQLRLVKISDLKYIEKKDIIPVITENIEYYVPQIAQLTKNSIILPFNQVSQLNDLKRVSNRKSNIVIRRSQTQTDTIKYILPQNLKAEKLPAVGFFSSMFGSYKLDVISSNNIITLIRTIEWSKGVFSPELYPELVQYQRKINEMDKQIIILKNKLFSSTS